MPTFGFELYRIYQRHDVAPGAVGFNGCNNAGPTVPAEKIADVNADPAVEEFFAQLGPALIWLLLKKMLIISFPKFLLMVQLIEKILEIKESINEFHR